MKFLLLAILAVVALGAASAGYIRSGWYPSYGHGGYSGGYSGGYGGYGRGYGGYGGHGGWHGGYSPVIVSRGYGGWW